MKKSSLLTFFINLPPHSFRANTWLLLLVILVLAPLIGVLVIYSPILIVILMGTALVVLFTIFYSAEPLILLVLVIRRILDINKIFDLEPFFLPYATAINATITALLIGVCILLIVLKRVNVLGLPLSRQWFVLLAIGGISVFIARDHFNSVQQWLRLVSFAAIYLLVVMTVRSRKQVSRLIITFVIATIVPNLAALSEVYFNNRVERNFRYLDIPRVYENLGSGPAHAMFLIAPILIVLMLFMRARVFWIRASYFVVLMGLGIPFFYTLARAAWTGAALALLVMLFFESDNKYRIRYLLLVACLVGLVIAIPVIRQRYLAIADPGLDSSLIDRMAIWSVSLDLFRSSPILGVGLGTADAVAGRIARGVNVAVHNDLIRIGTDLGIIGLLAYFWLYLSLLRSIFAVYRVVRLPMFRSLAIAGIGFWIAIQIANLFNNVFTSSVIQYSYWAFVGLIIALPRIEDSERA